MGRIIGVDIVITLISVVKLHVACTNTDFVFKIESIFFLAYVNPAMIYFHNKHSTQWVVVTDITADIQSLVNNSVLQHVGHTQMVKLYVALCNSGLTDVPVRLPRKMFSLLCKFILIGSKNPERVQFKCKQNRWWRNNPIS